MKSFRLLACALAMVVLPAANGEDRAEAFAQAVEQRIADTASVRGDDPDWFFLTRELKHLALGKFWNKPWSEVARNGLDPEPSILEFADLLRSRGINLLLVPIPPKARVYPDKLLSSFSPGEVGEAAPYWERYRKAGIEVLDLQPIFLSRRQSSPETILYCRQDAHFSPAAIEIVAAEIAAHLGMSAAQSGPFGLSTPETISITGDQISGTDWEGQIPAEELVIRRAQDSAGQLIEPSPGSEVLLLGDSHTMVFNAGETTGMHSSGAGLPDHLAYALGRTVDVVGNPGSGLVQARKTLFFHAAEYPGYWDSKRWVVWVFSERELTQSRDKFLPIPLER